MTIDIRPRLLEVLPATADQLDTESAAILESVRRLLGAPDRPTGEILLGLESTLHAIERFRGRLERTVAGRVDRAALPGVLRARDHVRTAQGVVSAELALRRLG